jgi:adenine C2-methylase RlmN of 23S rRNA A2503 and tRNA A37
MQRQFQVLKSKLDRSVNFVLPNGLEARYVRRSEDYFIVYLSSHNGCDKACRFCHLTQTKQTQFEEATIGEIKAQAKLVIEHYKKQIELGVETSVNKVHFNWMARGEALASSTIKHNWVKLSSDLVKMANDAGVSEVKFKISTIMPAGYGFQDNYMSPPGTSRTNLLQWYFAGPHKPVIYYSLYSLDVNFRKKWLPKALNPEFALFTLTEWQRKSGVDVVLHWAFIEGQNDRPADIEAIISLIDRVGLKARFNLVRYNPFDRNLSKESSKEVIEANFEAMSKAMKLQGSKIVSRVGLDVAASCGVFININKGD